MAERPVPPLPARSRAPLRRRALAVRLFGLDVGPGAQLPPRRAADRGGRPAALLLPAPARPEVLRVRLAPLLRRRAAAVLAPRERLPVVPLLGRDPPDRPGALGALGRRRGASSSPSSGAGSSASGRASSPARFLGARRLPRPELALRDERRPARDARPRRPSSSSRAPSSGRRSAPSPSPGAAAGLALATKASAATLAPPARPRAAPPLPPDAPRSPARSAPRAAPASACAAAFLAGQPSALLAARELLAGVAEQGRMVRHAGSVPYTNQYVGVAEGPLRRCGEIVLWGLGPALGLAALAGAPRPPARLSARARAARARSSGPGPSRSSSSRPRSTSSSRATSSRSTRSSSSAAAALLAAAGRRGRPGAGSRGAPSSALTGGLPARVPLDLRAPAHRSSPPPTWFHENVPPGATVLTQHWDEGFPFSLPGPPAGPLPDRRASASTTPTAPRRRALLAARARLRRTSSSSRRSGSTAPITRAPERYPDTDRLFRLLFAGDLGYSLVAHVLARRRSSSALRLPSELADESFSVYDHPKAVVFRNAARLDAAELERRLRGRRRRRRRSRRDRPPPAPRPDDPHADSDERDSAAPGRRSSRSSSGPRSSRRSASRPGASSASRLPARPGRLRALEGRRRRPLRRVGLGASSSWGPSPSSPPSRSPWPPALVLLGGASRAARAAPFPARASGDRGRLLGRLPLLRRGPRLLDPEIFWGEKPMDFAFLNALLPDRRSSPRPSPGSRGRRSPTPTSATSSSRPSRKALGVHPALTFNLGVALDRRPHRRGALRGRGLPRRPPPRRASSPSLLGALRREPRRARRALAAPGASTSTSSGPSRGS